MSAQEMLKQRIEIEQSRKTMQLPRLNRKSNVSCASIGRFVSLWDKAN